MRSVRRNMNCPTTNGLAELNHHIRDEQKEVRDVIVTNGHGLSEEDESRINEDREVLDGPKELVQPQAFHQRPQQQHQGPQGPVVCWERFLPLRSLKVLLVENDDSTRHVVSALLRNCSYEVTAVANGLEAWRILEDSTNHIGLVLAEVVLPCLSGIALLGKIMSHKTCMNIPVIMMSSNDSMGIVFKCLSKGAVDFLVKPIRKNELKNLWQHVWRKCHSLSGSGSGSESGIRTKESSKSKSIEGSDNNTCSKYEDENTSIGLNGRDGNGSDNGSGTQSSWTKRALEVDSSQPLSPWDHLEDPLDGTCAQVVHSRLEAFGNNWLPKTATKEWRGVDDELDNLTMGKDLEIGVPRNPDLRLEDRSIKVLTTLAGSAKKEKVTKLESNRGGDNLLKDELELISGTPNGELTKEVADLNESIIQYSNPQIRSIATQFPSDVSKENIKDKAICDTQEIPSLELSLKRLRDVGEIRNNAQERNVLRHSAFSRYTTTTATQVPTGNVGSCSPIDNSSEIGKTESLQNLNSNSDDTPNRRSNGSSNNNDMGSTTNNAFSDQPTSKSGVNIHHSSTFEPIPNSHVQVQHHHHHYHHHHHHVHNMKHEQKQQPNHDDLSLRTMVKSDLHCGPSNLLSTPIEGNAANYSLNGSASGSKNGSNEQNGNCAGVLDEGTNMESDNGVAGKCTGGGGSGSMSGVDQNHITPREAALNKFRQKRKERCFEKKVRYHSRKKLAEQRPRVRGQFVRQIVCDNEIKDEDS